MVVDMSLIQGDAVSFPRIGGDNEDVASVNEKLGLAIVLDGATPLSENIVLKSMGHNEVNKFIYTLTKFITSEVRNNPQQSLSKSVLNAGRLLEEKALLLGLPVGDSSPSAAMAVVRMQKNKTEICVIGDCTVVAQIGNQYTAYTSNDIRKLDREALAVLKLKLNAGMSYVVAKQQISNFLKKNRKRKNRPDGYYIADMSITGYKKVKSYTLHHVDALFLCTDGYEEAVAWGICHDIKELARQTISGNGQNILAALRKEQEDDPEIRKVVRFKPSDDASYAVLINHQ